MKKNIIASFWNGYTEKQRGFTLCELEVAETVSGWRWTVIFFNIGFFITIL